MHATDVIRVRRFPHHQLQVGRDGIAAWQKHWFTTGFIALEELLARREIAWPFCFGETPGWADLHLAPQVRKGLTRFELDLSPYPLIAGIHQACAGLPAFIAAPPPEQPDYPGLLIEPTLTRINRPTGLLL